VSNTSADLDGALAAIAKAIESMSSRQVIISNEISALCRRKRERLDARVEFLLPDISSDTMVRLKAEVPTFASDSKVVAAFVQNKRIFGIFKTARYDETLALLRTQLKLFVERQGLVKEDDQAILQVESVRSALLLQQSSAHEMLSLLERARSKQARLRAETAASINMLASRGRMMGSNASPRALPQVKRVSSGPKSATSSSKDDGDDIWLWMMTDIPTSLRTMVLAALSDHHSASPTDDLPPIESGSGGVFGGGGATGDFIAPVAVAILGAGAAAATAASIATDDSLGAFS